MSSSISNSRRVFGKVNSNLVVLDALRKSSGDLLEFGDGIEISLRKDFGDFAELIERTASGATIHDPPQGGPGDPDPRWIPAHHNNSQFNVEIVIGENIFTETGKYRLSAYFEESIKHYEVVITD